MHQNDTRYPENIAFLLLGGNQGNVLEKFKTVLQLLSDDAMQIADVSPVYQTQSWGFHASGDFFNQVVKIYTHFLPDDLLKWVLHAEEKLGRKRKANKYSSRTIDIDILFYGNFVIRSENLVIPHPRLHLRKFTLVPLNDIAPSWQHPVLKKSVSELLFLCKDDLKVTLHRA